ncbi:MAG TPA: TonB-dependent receptor [Longimicrobiales bacterium]|nr:TonB-dependent receptor [Longimicrobiales bacterium]
MRALRWLIISLAVCAMARPVTAQTPPPPAVIPLEPLNVTATRGAREVFNTAVPITVIDGRALRLQSAAAAADRFRALPGLDVEGVGPGRQMPVIRGLRGQRVLLLEDGLRLNQPRRRVDSGEPFALAGLTEPHRIEVIRGPASVLYGSDALGGVVNLVTQQAPLDGRARGSALAEWLSAGNLVRTTVEGEGGTRQLGVRITAGYRRAADYSAPAGRFGGIEVPSETRVLDTGVEDRSARAELRLRLDAQHQVFARHESYRSDDTGFGFFEPDPAATVSTVRITVPRQQLGRTVIGWSAADLHTTIADRVDLVAYRQSNERDFVTRVHSPMSGATAGAVDITSLNFTALRTLGFRLEAARLTRGQLLTYGIELTHDRSLNTDSSATAVTMPPAPARVSSSGGSSVPDARLLNLGAFVQSEFDPSARLHTVFGLRYQRTRSEPLATRGYDETLGTADDGTLAGAANLLYRASPRLNLVGGVSRGFRSPNLIERFFAGPTPEGRGFWVINPGLQPETSFNLDLGLRYRRARLRAEAFVFRNRLHHGIVLEPTGDTVGRRTVYRNVNVERLQYQGIEAMAQAMFGHGVSVAASFAATQVADLRNEGRTFAETYPYKAQTTLRYDQPAGRFWAEWTARHTGSTTGLLPGTSPVGDRLPAFTVHDARIGLRVHRQHVVVGVRNATNRLYSEVLNSGLFRPEPGRGYFASVIAEF